MWEQPGSCDAESWNQSPKVQRTTGSQGSGHWPHEFLFFSYCFILWLFPPHPSHHVLCLALFLSFNPISLSVILFSPVSQPFHWANTAGPIFICLSPPLHLLGALMFPPFPSLCLFFNHLQLRSLCLTVSVSPLSIKNRSSLPVQLWNSEIVTTIPIPKPD